MVRLFVAHALDHKLCQHVQRLVAPLGIARLREDPRSAQHTGDAGVEVLRRVTLMIVGVERGHAGGKWTSTPPASTTTLRPK
jgi:hypothetical protein